MRFSIKEQMIKYLSERIGKGICNAKSFLGDAYHQGSKFIGGIDRAAHIARKVLTTVAPVAGALSGPAGAAVGAAVSMGMKGLSMYVSLQTEAMGHMNDMARVGNAINKGLN